jgi:hypothetical protein
MSSTAVDKRTEISRDLGTVHWLFRRFVLLQFVRPLAIHIAVNVTERLTIHRRAYRCSSGAAGAGIQ